MHEMSLMASVFEIAQQQIENIPVIKVLKVKLQVGELANALEDALRMAFEAFSQETVFENAVLELETIPATWRCPNKHEFIAGVGVSKCPSCQSGGLELIKGRDLLLESLEVE